MLSIEKYEIYHISHKAEEYVYTGATVGNVTMGGVHKNDAYNYVSGSSQTGKYCIRLCKEHIVRKIKLTDELFSQARISAIAPYLDERTKSIVVVEDVPLSEVSRDNLLAGNFNTVWMVRQREVIPRFPSYEKCKQIVDWLNNKW